MKQQKNTGHIHDIQPPLEAVGTQRSWLIRVVSGAGGRLQKTFAVISRRWLQVAGVVVVALGLFGCGAWGHQAVRVAGILSQAYDAPIAIRFVRPVKSSLQYSLQENVVGTWRIERSVAGVSAVIFQPKTVLPPGAVLHVRLRHIQPQLDIASGTAASQAVPISVEKAPAVRRVLPATGAQSVQSDAILSLELAGANRGLRKLELRGDIPVVSVIPESKNDTVFQWRMKETLQQGKTYTADVLDAHQSPGAQKVATYSFTTVAEPGVASSEGIIRPGDAIVLQFDQDMVQIAEGLSFDAPGSGTWTTPRQYTYRVGAVTPGKTYGYRVAKGVRSTAGGFVATEKVYSVQTPGVARVAATQPLGTRVGLQSPVKLTFNQEVDHASAQAAFSISPAVEGSFSWVGTTMVFTPRSYAYQTTYSYGVAAGIQPVFGLPGVAHSARFSTVYEVRKLNVPFFRQAHALSCEAASLRMALGMYGVSTSDDEILSRMSYAPQPRDTATNTWQDPNVEFVGDVDGKLSVTGWGVYAGPVAAVARSFGRSADVVYGPSVAHVAAAIHAGRPVVVWGMMGTAAIDDSWNTATNGVVHAAKNQHVRVVYGVEGSPDDPAGFYLQDPLRGSVYVSAALLQASMNGGGRQVLVVY